MAIIANLKDNVGMNKKLLIFMVSSVILITAYFTLVSNSSSKKPPTKSEIETAVNQARHTYTLEKQSGRDLSSGPCLSNALMPNWVLDIAHSPRQPIDDLPENQCLSYREGKAEHFVELDLNGNLLRAK